MKVRNKGERNVANGSTLSSAVERLYAKPIASQRRGAMYNAFSYPTKIDPESIALFIAAHTAPGDTVLDVFAGSGTTGLGVRLCERPTAGMKKRAQELGLPVEWGPRNAVLYELSVLGSLLSSTMCTPPLPGEFTKAAQRVLATVSKRYGWMYAAEGPDGTDGSLRHAIWSEVIICECCQNSHSYWDLAVSRDPLSLRQVSPCPTCKVDISLSNATRGVETISDPLTGLATEQRLRRIAHIYGRNGRSTWQRPPLPSDTRLIERVMQEPIPDTVPFAPLQWADLHRSGYHQGIDRIHHFYTRRNLIALGAIWQAIELEPVHLREALRLVVLSYNAAHATLMSRIVVKKGMPDFVLTGAQSGVLYISSLPVEKNIFDGISRKIRTFKTAFEATYGCSGEIRVVNGSSTDLDLPDRSIDYVFTDPPFGAFIPYAEINQINEMWLGQITEDKEEVIISAAKQKGAPEYTALMKKVFAEVARVMKEDARATVVFHSSKPEVWRALGDSIAEASFSVERTSMLNKTQVSFKQVVSEGSTRGDAIFLLSRGNGQCTTSPVRDLRNVILELIEHHGDDQTPQHLYSRYVAQCIENGLPVEVTSNDFYSKVRGLSKVQ